LGAGAGQERARHHRGGVLGHVAVEDERLHAVLPGMSGLANPPPKRRRTEPMGMRVRGAPSALAKFSTRYPRLRASEARRVSGLTATGNPTISSIGRSLVES